MDRTEVTTSARPRAGEEAVSIYDRFAHLYDLMFRVNGYGRSVERYLAARRLDLPTGARVLDAGCGTGLLTLALARVLRKPADITSVDLSHASLQTARRAVAELREAARHRVRFARANALRLPFPDGAFRMVATSGVVEYLPLGEGLKELARVLAPGGYFLHLPVVPSAATRLLELMFRFKAHPPSEVSAHTERHFRVIERHRFSPLEPIGWTKIAVLAQKQ
ncbi:MAG TPA: class I SAM-dependent methyltransferase [Pyrinomonadaceae bacterium]|nr:class I SAM-dependent methyltransferase [Pyrinomonadaceae bacterium]